MLVVLLFVFLQSVENYCPYLENIQGWSEWSPSLWENQRLLLYSTMVVLQLQPEKNHLVKTTIDGRAFKVSDLVCPVRYVSKKFPCDLGGIFFLPHML